jgi:NAD(P)-dependent dehydrogenase (short-subunit alcohol dehydrogenase family)
VAPAGFDVDVSSPASVARLASLAKDHLGGIDVWINNAGYSGSFQVQRSCKDERPACQNQKTFAVVGVSEVLSSG